MRQTIQEHEGSKYLRPIFPALKKDAHQADGSMLVDVYEVLMAFKVTCPATQHAIKKLLCAGLREKGDREADLKGAMAALNRAIDIEEACTLKEDGTPKDTRPLYNGERVDSGTPPHDPVINHGKWEVCDALDGVLGFHVRWSVPNKEGEYLYVRHYLTDEKDDSPSIGWCRNAAESDAKRMNDQNRVAWEFRSWVKAEQAAEV